MHEKDSTRNSEWNNEGRLASAIVVERDRLCSSESIDVLLSPQRDWLLLLLCNDDWRYLILYRHRNERERAVVLPKSGPSALLSHSVCVGSRSVRRLLEKEIMERCNHAESTGTAENLLGPPLVLSSRTSTDELKSWFAD